MQKSSVFGVGAWVLSSCLVMAAALPATVGAQGDNVLEMIDAEAREVDIDHAGIADSADATDTLHSDRYQRFMTKRQFIPAGLGPREFKVYLFNEFFDVYSGYAELSKAQQSKVYQYYQQLPQAKLHQIDSKIQQLLN